jgi:internalin A
MGRVGKTQICRRLRGEDYDDNVPSTHGIVVTSANLPAREANGHVRLNIWDFGGQDIYHGNSRAFYAQQRNLHAGLGSGDRKSADA